MVGVLLQDQRCAQQSSSLTPQAANVSSSVEATALLKRWLVATAAPAHQQVTYSSELLEKSYKYICNGQYCEKMITQCMKVEHELLEE